MSATNAKQEDKTMEENNRLLEMLKNDSVVADPNEQVTRLNQNTYALLNAWLKLDNDETIPWYVKAYFAQSVGTLIKKANIVLEAEMEGLLKRMDNLTMATSVSRAIKETENP